LGAQRGYLKIKGDIIRSDFAMENADYTADYTDAADRIRPSLIRIIRAICGKICGLCDLCVNFPILLLV